MIEFGDKFITNHPLVSMILFGILTNLLTDLIKYSFAKTISNSKLAGKRLSKKLVRIAISGYESEYNEVKRFRENRSHELEIYGNNLANIIYVLIFMFGSYFFIEEMNIPIKAAYYAIAGNRIFQVLIIIYTHRRVVNREKYFDKYEAEINSKIFNLKSYL